jgi:DNA-binding GntR family transcriptional regulator
LHATSSSPARADAADGIARDIWRRVRVGDLVEGDRLRESEIAARYGHSRHTVRAALRQLRSEGLVEHDLHRSARVRSLSAADVRDLYAVRRLVEFEALRRMTEEDAPIAGLTAAVREIERIEGSRAHDELPGPDEIDADVEFHRALVSSIGSPRLFRMFDVIAAELRLAFVALGSEPSPHGDHRAMLDAIAARETDTARSLLELHMRAGLRICLTNRA